MKIEHPARRAVGPDTWGALRAAVSEGSAADLSGAMLDHFAQPRPPEEVEYAVREWLRRRRGGSPWPLILKGASSPSAHSRLRDDPWRPPWEWAGWSPFPALARWVLPMDPCFLEMTEALAIVHWFRSEAVEARQGFLKVPPEDVPALKRGLESLWEDLLLEDPARFLNLRRLLIGLRDVWESASPESLWRQGWEFLLSSDPEWSPGFLADALMNRTLTGRGQFWGGRVDLFCSVNEVRPSKALPVWEAGLACAQRQICSAQPAVLEFVIHSAVRSLSWANQQEEDAS